MKALVDTFHQEKALVGAFSVILYVNTYCETDGSFYRTIQDTREVQHKQWVTQSILGQ